MVAPKFPSWRWRKERAMGPDLRWCLSRALFFLALLLLGATLVSRNPNWAASFVCTTATATTATDKGEPFKPEQHIAESEQYPTESEGIQQRAGSNPAELSLYNRIGEISLKKYRLEFDCLGAPQSAPVFAHRVEGFARYPFFISLADLGTPDKPNRNFLRVLKGKLFRTPAISLTIQSLLGRLRKLGNQPVPLPVIVDVGANVGMAAFAASAMGFPVLAFEAVLENVYKLCDGIHLNRASSVKIFHAAVSDRHGHITLHKVVGRLDNSAVSASGATMAFKSNKVIPINVTSVTLDSIIPPSTPVLLLKIDVQGWEYHVLKGAAQLLSRSPKEAPFIIYEDDDKLLKESNSSSQEILEFLRAHGYKFCSRVGGDQHCSKEPLPE